MDPKNPKLDNFLKPKKKPLATRVREFMDPRVRFPRHYKYYESYFHLHLVGKYKRFMRESFPVIFFIAFSTYITYLMHDELDVIKRKVQRNKSYKEEIIDKENVALNNIIKDPKNQQYNKQIREIQRSKKYKHEKYGKDEDDVYSEHNHMYMEFKDE